MLKSTLILLILALAQYGCSTSEETGSYKPVELSSEWQQGLERSKREFLQIEDLTIGYGPVAALGRKVSGRSKSAMLKGMASRSIAVPPSAILECKVACSSTMAWLSMACCPCSRMESSWD